ncbi:MAG: SAF domain-containing protein [Candidatus Dormibacteraceae bacterium]
MRRWLGALAALLAGGLASAGVLAAGGGGAGAERVFVAVRDLPAGAQLDASELAVATVHLERPQAAAAFAADSPAPLLGRHAVHALTAGQIIQRGDLERGVSLRLVLVTIKDLPPTRPGDLVDLFALGDPGRPLVTPFALGVRVAAVTPGGLVLSVPTRQAPAFVFAGSMPLAAVVVSGPGGGDGEPVGSAQQAADLARS